MQSGRRGSREARQAVETARMHEVVKRATPGTPLRTAIERIIEQGSGALVVLGSGPSVEQVCTGGFVLEDSPFTPARLAELSKMDGATVLDDQWEHILRANVHLLPDATTPTEETGARHRTAERVARQTGKPVLAVSEERVVATLYLGDERYQLRDPAELGAELNQSLITLERFRTRLDEAVERMTRLEVNDAMTYRAVVVTLHRAELVLRIGEKVETEAIGLGAEGHLIALQLGDLLGGVARVRELVVRDYVRPTTDERLVEGLEALRNLETEQLPVPERVALSLGFEHPDAHARPRGFRLVSHVPRLPEAVREAGVLHFEDFHDMLHASAERLSRVEGIGRARAMELREFFDRLLVAHGQSPRSPAG